MFTTWFKKSSQPSQPIRPEVEIKSTHEKFQEAIRTINFKELENILQSEYLCYNDEKILLRPINSDGDTVLAWALKNNHINFFTEFKNKTMLMHFMNTWDDFKINLELLCALIDKSDFYFNKKDTAGQTIFAWAMQNNHYKIIERLLKKHNFEIDREIYTSPGNMETPLTLAIKNDNSRIINILINYSKIDLSLCNSEGKSPIFLAKEKDNKELYSNLLSRGAITDFFMQINITNNALTCARITSGIIQSKIKNIHISALQDSYLDTTILKIKIIGLNLNDIDGISKLLITSKNLHTLYQQNNHDSFMRKTNNARRLSYGYHFHRDTQAIRKFFSTFDNDEIYIDTLGITSVNRVDEIKDFRNFIDILDTIDPFGIDAYESILSFLAKYIGVGIYSYQMVYTTLEKKLLENPRSMFKTAANFHANGLDNAFFIATELLVLHSPDLAFEIINEIKPSDHYYVAAKYIQATILLYLDRKDCIKQAYHALDDAGNSDLISSLRTKLLDRLIGGSGFSDILPCQADISSNAMLTMATEIADLKRKAKLQI